MAEERAIMHLGRAFQGHRPEDECPCPQEACGLVAEDRIAPECEQHKPTKTIRQGHLASACPGKADG
jgi:hypothetical protein